MPVNMSENMLLEGSWKSGESQEMPLTDCGIMGVGYYTHCLGCNSGPRWLSLPLLAEEMA